eukprot:757017-Hanusia_phi.AAC.6
MVRDQLGVRRGRARRSEWGEREGAGAGAGAVTVLFRSSVDSEELLDDDSDQGSSSGSSGKSFDVLLLPFPPPSSASPSTTSPSARMNRKTPTRLGRHREAQCTWRTRSTRRNGVDGDGEGAEEEEIGWSGASEQ